MNFLFNLSDVALLTLLTFFSISISIVAIYLVKLFIPINLRYKDNTVIGNTASLISVIYGVLAGLSALYLINNNSYTADAVQREANAVADIYRDSQWMKEPVRQNVQAEIKSYLTRVINDEWPIMAQGGKLESHDNSLLINSISKDLVQYQGNNSAEMLLVHDMLDEVRALYDARQQRLHMSTSQLSPELWVVILIGTILTLCINYLFGMNFKLHIITVSAAALMTSSMIFLLITLDRPFQGEFSIRPDAFTSLLTFIEKNEQK